MLNAVWQGDAKKVAQLMRRDPGFNVNLAQNGEEETLLHYACAVDMRSAVIPLLLAHPGIDVNTKDINGQSPFNLACRSGCTSCVREMLKDSRVILNEPTKNGTTPLYWAAAKDHLGIIKWWIASGREMELGKPGDIDQTDVLRKKGKTEMVTLLERFKENPEKTKYQVRRSLDLVDEMAAKMFALVVFVSDGLLQIKDTTPSPAARFFNIARRLPLELQMGLCYRIVGSPKEIIPSNETEVAFKELARRL